jgi:hypothetical protein
VRAESPRACALDTREVCADVGACWPELLEFLRVINTFIMDISYVPRCPDSNHSTLLAKYDLQRTISVFNLDRLCQR